MNRKAKMFERAAPRVIQNEEELDQYAKALFRLTETTNPTAAELQAIELLTLLVEQYEDRMHPIPSATPVEILRYLMDRHQLKQKDLVPELGSESNPAPHLCARGKVQCAALYLRVKPKRQKLIHPPAGSAKKAVETFTSHPSRETRTRWMGHPASSVLR